MNIKRIHQENMLVLRAKHFGFDVTNEDAEKITAVMDAIQIFHSYVKQRLAVAEKEE